MAEKLLTSRPSTQVADTAKKQLAASLNNIGYIYKMHGDIPKALEYFGNGLKIQEEIGDKQGMALSLVFLGNLYLKQNNISNALLLGERAYRLSKELGFPDNIERSAGLLKQV
ncbi:MAG: tetratricopeptide repeat protein [Bacteroidia bacterium]|nr:tetratricopeptide repeat protein [Bacteroidia bacterium]